jgi:cysteine desulfurase
MGGLFIRSDLEISPFILGGQEQGHMRGGSLSIPLLLEFGKWAKHERAYTDHYCTEIARLRTLFEEKLMEAFPDVQILFGNQERLPHISSCIFSGVASETLAFALAQKEIQASFGGNRLQHFVHILKACGVPSPNCHCGLSFTFSSETTEEEITLGASLIGQTAVHMQKYSLSLLDEERHEL